jgi:hypothetical protein
MIRSTHLAPGRHWSVEVYLPDEGVGYPAGLCLASVPRFSDSGGYTEPKVHAFEE